MVETFCILFSRGFVEDVARATAGSDHELLADPWEQRPIEFHERIRTDDRLLAPLLETLRCNGDKTLLWQLASALVSIQGETRARAGNANCWRAIRRWRTATGAMARRHWDSRNSSVRSTPLSFCSNAARKSMRSRRILLSRSCRSTQPLSAGRKDIVLLVLARGADVNVREGGSITVLHEAAGLGSAEYVKLLVESGADPAAKNGRWKAAGRFRPCPTVLRGSGPARKSAAGAVIHLGL